MFNFDFDFNFNFGAASKENEPQNFEEFCKLAGYPKPFPKQEEMRQFAFPEKKELEQPRLLLAARQLGKTDYVVILGLAYKIWRDRLFYGLLITKEYERGTEILAEIRTIIMRVGVALRGKSERKIYTKEATGKEPTLTNLAVRSKGLRGRHPQLVILEDLITPDDASQAERRRVEKVYEEVLKLTQNVVLIGQPVHKLDLFQKLRYLIRTMEVPHGVIPELDADLKALKAAGVSEYSIAASYHLEILDDASLPFSNIKSVNFAADQPVAFIDPSFKGGDYTALAIGGMHFSNLIVSGFAFKKAWDDCLEEFKLLFEFFGVQSVMFETNNLGNQPVRIMQELGAPCVEKFSKDNKHARIINCGFYSNFIKLHDVENLPSDLIEANQIFNKQVREYEYGVDNDDAPDALAGLKYYLGV